jgi:hypothetical protein
MDKTRACTKLDFSARRQNLTRLSSSIAIEQMNWWRHLLLALTLGFAASCSTPTSLGLGTTFLTTANASYSSEGTCNPGVGPIIW